MGLLAPGKEGVCQNAQEMLQQRGVTVKKVVTVDTDAVLYLDGLGRPKTAWLRYTAGHLVLAYDSGFPCEPSPAARRQLDRSAMDHMTSVG